MSTDKPYGGNPDEGLLHFELKGERHEVSLNARGLRMLENDLGNRMSKLVAQWQQGDMGMTDYHSILWAALNDANEEDFTHQGVDNIVDDFLDAYGYQAFQEFMNALLEANVMDRNVDDDTKERYQRAAGVEDAGPDTKNNPTQN